jgi:hypothetical protein
MKMQIQSRPLSVTIIGFILLLWGVITAWRIISAVSLIYVNGLWLDLISRDGLLLVDLVIVTMVELLAGVFVLRGANWARMLWSIWCVLHIAMISFLSGGTNPSLSSLAAQSIIILFLFLPRANEFFKRDS